MLKAKININYLLVGTKISLLILGMIVSYNLFLDTARPTGVINAGVFGNLSVLLFFVVLIFSQHESLRHKIFSLLSLFSGLFTIIASGTRGAWLTLFLLSGVCLYFFYKQKTKFRTKSKIIVVIVVSILISLGSINQNIYDRTNLAFVEISGWFSGDKSPTSVGLRLTMYKEAINHIEDVPLFGHGYRTSNIVLFQNENYINYPKITTQTLAGYNHLHNALLTNYYNGGIVLLGALLLLLFIPFRIFIKANSQNRQNPVFISGVLLTLGYASFGMVNILFGDTYMNGFFCIFLSYLYGF